MRHITQCKPEHSGSLGTGGGPTPNTTKSTKLYQIAFSPDTHFGLADNADMTNNTRSAFIGTVLLIGYLLAACIQLPGSHSLEPDWYVDNRTSWELRMIANGTQRGLVPAYSISSIRGLFLDEGPFLISADRFARSPEGTLRVGEVRGNSDGLVYCTLWTGEELRLADLHIVIDVQSINTHPSASDCLR